MPADTVCCVARASTSASSGLDLVRTPSATIVTLADVQELRITLTVDDFDAAVRLYRDALELPQVADWSRWGERVSGKVRLALQVPDADLSAASLVAAGATPVAPAVATPWGDRNAGVAAPDGMQLTLFTPGEES